MKPLDCHQLLDELLACTLHAGRVQLAHRAAGVTSARKADRSPVTLADQQSEEIILTGLLRALPGVPVVAEEAVSRGEVPPPASQFLLVDPLDGTREFIRGGDDFTVNIALIADGAPVFGIVYAPAMNRLYATIARDTAIEARIAPDQAVRRLADVATNLIATRDPDPTRLVALASRTHGIAETDVFLARLGVEQRVNIGSSLKFCRIARGDADVYPRFGAINEWDTAAGHALLNAAGGCVTVGSGAELAYGKAAAGYLNPPFVAWGRRALACPF